MRWLVGLGGVCLVLLALGTGCGGQPDYTGQDPDSVFTADIVPVLRDQCESCHFPGGPMYQTMPFDDATVVGDLEDELLSRLSGAGKRRVAAWQELRRQAR